MLTAIKKLWGSKEVKVKTPVILQMEITECGAAALAAILGYYGCFVPLEKLRVQCGVSRDGSRADFILQAAREYGLKAQAGSLEWDMVGELTFPCIAHWCFNHFVVLEGYNKKGVFINDPAIGRRLVDYEEFKKSFTGIALLFEPGEGFKEQGEPLNLWNFFRHRFRNSRDAIYFILLASFLLVIPGIAIPGFSKIFIDDILGNRWHNWLQPLILGLIFTGLLRALITWLQQNCLLRLRLKFLITSSIELVNHIFSLPALYFQQRFAGDIADRMASNERITQLFSNELATSIFSFFALIFYAIFMMLLSPWLALISFCSLGIQAKFWLYFSESLAEKQYRYLQERGKLVGIEMNALRMITLLKATQSEQSFFQRWASYHAAAINTEQHLMSQQKWLMLFQQFIVAMTTVLILSVGIWQILRGYFTVGSLVAFQSLLASFQAPLQTWLNLAVNIQKIKGDVSRLNDVFNYPTDKRLSITNTQADKNKNFSAEIAVENLTFGYSPRRPPQIKSLSFQVTAGSCVAWVGRSGSGKSTLIKLLLGLLQPWSGEIRWNGCNLTEISSAELATKVAYVDQEIKLFSGTIRENLTLWQDDIDDTVLYRALDCVELTEIIKERGGLDMQLAESGANFSGGQQQRLEIARALAHLPQILILDEATSNQDLLLEQRLLQAIRKLGITIILISHRLSAIRDCDQIFVLDHGQLVQQGKHTELMEQVGIYRSLVFEENAAS